MFQSGFQCLQYTIVQIHSLECTPTVERKRNTDKVCFLTTDWDHNGNLPSTFSIFRPPRHIHHGWEKLYPPKLDSRRNQHWFVCIFGGLALLSLLSMRARYALTFHPRLCSLFFWRIIRAVNHSRGIEPRLFWLVAHFAWVEIAPGRGRLRSGRNCSSFSVYKMRFYSITHCERQA